MSRRAGTALMNARCPQERDIQKRLEQQCQERTVGKVLMTAEMTLLGCKKKERGEDVGLGQKWLSLDVWGLECGVQGGLAELDPARLGLGKRAGRGFSGTV